MSIKGSLNSKITPSSIIDGIEIMVVGLMFVIKVIPQLQYTFTGLAWSFIYHVVFALWTVITLFRNPKWIIKTKELQTTLFWIFYLFVMFIIFRNTQWGYFSLLLSFWEPLIIFYYYTQIDDAKKKRETIAWIVIIALVYSLLRSIQSVNGNELAAREASSGHSSEDAVLTGNYSFTATITIMVGIMLCYLQTHNIRRNKLKSAMALIVVIGSYIFIFRCNLMISILCIIIEAFLYLALSGKKKIKPLQGIIVFFTAIFLLFFLTTIGGILANFVDWIGTMIDSDTITDRTRLMSAWLRGGSMDGNLESRIDLCLVAINTFLKNPIFGIGPQNNASLYFLTHLGLHATFFDEWARFGIIGMTFLIITFVRFYMYTNKNIDEGIPLKAFKSGFWIFIVISMLNPVASANVGIALFYLVPVIAIESDFARKEKVKS